MGSFNVALLEALLAVGVPHERARQIVDLFDKSVDERFGLHAQVLATKRDLAELQAAMLRETTAAEQRLAGEIARSNERIARTEERIAALDQRTSGGFTTFDERMTARFAAADERMTAGFAAADERIAARIAETKSELVRWMLAALTAQTALLVGAMRLL